MLGAVVLIRGVLICELSFAGIAGIAVTSNTPVHIWMMVVVRWLTEEMGGLWVVHNFGAGIVVVVRMVWSMMQMWGLLMMLMMLLERMVMILTVLSGHAITIGSVSVIYVAGMVTSVATTPKSNGYTYTIWVCRCHSVTICSSTLRCRIIRNG